MAIYILGLCVRIFLANYRGTDGWWADVNDFDRVESPDRAMVATQTFVIKFFFFGCSFNSYLNSERQNFIQIMQMKQPHIAIDNIDIWKESMNADHTFVTYKCFLMI